MRKLAIGVLALISWTASAQVDPVRISSAYRAPVDLVKESETAILATNKVEQGARVTYQSARQVSLLPGFTASPGAVFEARIGSAEENRAGLSVKVYANPFAEKTTLEYTLPKYGAVAIRIFDSRGRLIENFGQEKKTAGTYRKDWNASGLPAGVYLYQVRFESQTRSGRLVKQ